MASKQPDIFNQIKALFKNLSTGKSIALLSLVGATIAGLISMIIWTGAPDFQLLYSNLTLEDAGEIVARLKEQKTPYEISSNGKAIRVPKETLYETRLSLANDGLPQGSGVGFEIFDNTKLGMTEFVQNVNYQRALQGELSRTINGFDEVESSRIHIVMPTRTLFIEDEEPPTASVVLKLRRGRRLSEGQVRGIVHLISASISQLAPENVTVIDNYGKMLAGSEDKSSIAKLSSDQFEYQEKVEKGLEKRIETMLEKILGPGKAISRISCSFDFRRHEKTEEIFDPNGKVVRSEKILKTVSNTSGSNAIGVPGVSSNIPSEQIEPPRTVVETSAKPKYQKENRTVNYEIGKVTSHTVEPLGRIERISVAVVIDGTHELVKGEEGEEWKYTPRSQEEIKKIEDIVKRAINFDAERGDEIEVANIPFEAASLKMGEEEIIEEGWLSKLEQHKGYFRYAFLGVFLLFSFLFVVKPLVRWLTSAPSGGAEMLKQLPMTVEEIERGYGEGAKSLPYRDRALSMLTGGEESTMSVAREWVSDR